MELVKFTFEYLFRASPTILYNFLSTPDCLIRWFCDEADVTGNEYTFTWDGNDEIAILIDKRYNEMLRFRWEDAENDGEYLEYSMSKSEVTRETILLITGFCENEEEVKEQQQYWETQIKRLRQATGG